jgi:AcrR family transcriptional regulator
MKYDDDRPMLGLRERKKAKTRAAIQREALRLFREQGYDATTVNQIAEAVEISPSTFFRYFPSKEDVVLYDDLDPLVIGAFEAQPPELTPIQAFRQALRIVYVTLSRETLDEQRERAMLTMQVPELRMRMLEQVVSAVDLFSQVVARRVGRSADDVQVRTFIGAVMGAILAVLLSGARDADADYLALMDEGLAYIEAGMPL